ncbi:hypothetical protein AB1E19_016358 [Capra hircus]
MSCEERALVSWPEERGPGCSLRPQSPETAVGAGRTASQGAVSARTRTAEPPPERPCTSDRQRGSRSPAPGQRLSQTGSLGGRASPRRRGRPEAPPPPAPPRARAVSMETAAGTRAQRPPAGRLGGARGLHRDGRGDARPTPAGARRPDLPRRWRRAGAKGRGRLGETRRLGARSRVPGAETSVPTPGTLPLLSPEASADRPRPRPPPSPGVMTVLAENLPAAHTEGCPQVLGAPRPGLQATSVPLARLLPRLGPLLAPRRPRRALRGRGPPLHRAAGSGPVQGVQRRAQWCRGGRVWEASGRGRGSKKHKLAPAPDQAVVVLNVVRRGAIKGERGALPARAQRARPASSGVGSGGGSSLGRLPGSQAVFAPATSRRTPAFGSLLRRPRFRSRFGTPTPAGPAPTPALPPGPRPGRGRSRLEPPRAPSPPAPPRPLAFLFPARPPGFRAPPATNPLATMSVELEEALPLTTAEGAAKKAAKAGGSAALSPSKKRKNSKKKNQPGKYSQLVVETIRRLGERNGSSLAKIYAEAKKVAWFDQQNGRTYLKYSIKALVQNDTLLQVKGTGANGSFKLNRKKLEGGGGERRGAPAPASAPAPAAHKAKKAAPGAAAPRRADKKPAKGPQPEKRSHKKGAASKKDKGSKAKKAAVAGGKKVKKAAKPSVPKVPKGRKFFETALATPLLALALGPGCRLGYRLRGANGRAAPARPVSAHEDATAAQPFPPPGARRTRIGLAGRGSVAEAPVCSSPRDTCAAGRTAWGLALEPTGPSASARPIPRRRPPIQTRRPGEPAERRATCLRGSKHLGEGRPATATQTDICLQSKRGGAGQAGRVAASDACPDLCAPGPGRCAPEPGLGSRPTCAPAPAAPPARQALLLVALSQWIQTTSRLPAHPAGQSWSQPARTARGGRDPEPTSGYDGATPPPASPHKCHPRSQQD